MKTRAQSKPQQEEKDSRFSRMVILSAAVHIAVIAFIVLAVARGRSGRAQPVAYTVQLVNPAALGTNIPPGGSKAASTPEPAAVEKPAAPQAQPKPEVKAPPVVKQEEPKVVQPPQPKEVVKLPEKEKPLEKPPVKPEPEKPKLAEKKPEVKKAEVRPDPAKAKPNLEEKKPETKKAETPAISAEERDRQILTALERIKTQVQGKEKSGLGGQAGGSGPPTIGGAPGESGGGLVRGLEFIMYTEQVKRRVKESWIVAEQKPGLSATVRFGIQPDGEVFAVELVKPSGDNAFDQSVVRAVKKANPLPPPPQTYQQEFATQKVEVTFGGEERVKQVN